MNIFPNPLFLGTRRLINQSEGVTSLIAGSYVIYLAVKNKNFAFGVAGGYLLFRGGLKMREIPPVHIETE